MTLQEIQACVTSFSRQELRQFSRWFHETVADAWDQQIEEDAKSGALGAMNQRLQLENAGEAMLPLDDVLQREDSGAGSRVFEESPANASTPGFHCARVDELQAKVQALPAPDFGAFVSWFEEYLADEWDRQIEEDERAGRLDAAGERAIKDFEEGRCTPL